MEDFFKMFPEKKNSIDNISKKYLSFLEDNNFKIDKAKNLDFKEIYKIQNGTKIDFNFILKIKGEEISFEN